MVCETDILRKKFRSLQNLFSLILAPCPTVFSYPARSKDSRLQPVHPFFTLANIRTQDRQVPFY